MVALDETTIGLTFAVVGVLATIVWYGLAFYGIRTLQDIRDAVSDSGQEENTSEEAR